MYAIDWMSWLQSPAREKQPQKVNPDDLIWEDSVTGTIFKIAKDTYWKLRQKLNNYLAKADGEQCYSVLSQKYIPFGQASDLELAVQLPYPEPKQYQDMKPSEVEIRTRIADHLLLRAGLYYAIHAPTEEEWRKLRPQLLQIESDVAKEIDLFLLTGQLPDSEEYKVALVKGGAVKIKEYLVETNNIQEIRGASILLDEINQQRIEQLCRQHWTPEVLVYSGGGNILLIVPEKDGKKAAYLIEDMIRQITVSARGVATYAPVSLSDLVPQRFSQTFGWLEMKKAERQMAMLPVNDDGFSKDINLYRPEKMIEKLEFIPLVSLESIDQDPFSTSSGKRICQLCKTRDAVHYLKKYKGETPATCWSCTHKIIAGKNVNRFVQEISDVLNRCGLAIRIDDFCETLEDLADGNRNDYIGVIYGDGNNMGGVVEKINSLSMYRYFSHLVDSAAKYAVYTSLHNVLGAKFTKENKANFEIIVVGGDDVFLIVPGEYALEVARKMGEKFDYILRQYRGEQHNWSITFSLGVAIGEYKLPFIRLYDTAVQLLKSAKTYQKQNVGQNKNGGTIDFMKLKTSTPFASGIKEYRKLNYERPVSYGGRKTLLRQIMRPYTFSQLKALEEWLEELKQKVPTARSLVYKLAEISENMTIEEAKLYYLYHVCSQAGSNPDRFQFHNLLIKQAGTPLVYGKNLQSDDLFFHGKQEGIIYSPWDDLAELWDVKEGTGWAAKEN